MEKVKKQYCVSVMLSINVFQRRKYLEQSIVCYKNKSEVNGPQEVNQNQ